MSTLLDLSDIFNFFFCSGRVKGESEVSGGGFDFDWKSEEGVGGLLQEGEGPRGQEGVCGELGNLGGGGG